MVLYVHTLLMYLAGDFSPSVIQAACAFLLNAKEYSFLAGLDHLYKPGKVAPRLAAVLNAKQEGSHMRKPIRDLFEAGMYCTQSELLRKCLEGHTKSVELLSVLFDIVYMS